MGYFWFCFNLANKNIQGNSYEADLMSVFRMEIIGSLTIFKNLTLFVHIFSTNLVSSNQDLYSAKNQDVAFLFIWEHSEFELPCVLPYAVPL